MAAVLCFADRRWRCKPVPASLSARPGGDLRQIMAARMSSSGACNYNPVVINNQARFSPMESKTARFTVWLDPRKKQAFEQLCAAQDLTPSQVVRQLIREYLDKNGVSYTGEPLQHNPLVR